MSRRFGPVRGAAVAAPLVVLALVVPVPAPTSAVAAPALTWSDPAPRHYGDGHAASGAIVSPRSSTVLADGSVVFYDTVEQTLRRVDGTSGTITSIAGNGTSSDCTLLDGLDPATTGLPTVEGLWSDAAGDIFVQGGQTNQPYYCYAAPIMRLDHVDKKWHVVVTNLVSTAGGAVLGRYTHATVASDATVFVTDATHRVVRAYAPGADPSGPGTIVAGTLDVAGLGGDGGQATSATITDPLLAAANGSLFLADGPYDRTLVRRVVLTTGVISHVGGSGTGASHGAGPDPAIGTSAATANLSVQALAVTPDASKVVISQNRGTSSDIDAFAVGGLLTSIAVGGGGYELSAGTYKSAPVAVSNAAAVTLRSWPLSGSGAAGAGSVVAGLDAAHAAVSADGAVLEDEFPGDVVDLAVAPSGEVAWAGSKVRSVASVTPTATVTTRSSRAARAVAYGADGTLAAATSDGTAWRIETFPSGSSVSTTRAGGGAGPLVDGATATSVALPEPIDVAYDSPAHTIYVLEDTGQPDPTYIGRALGQVWAIDTVTGLVHLVASDGADGIAIEGSSAVSAAMGRLWSIAVDQASHVLYVGGDYGLYRVVSGVVHGPMWTGYVPQPLSVVGGVVYGGGRAFAADGTATEIFVLHPEGLVAPAPDGSLVETQTDPGGGLLRRSDVLTVSSAAALPPATASLASSAASFTVTTIPSSRAGVDVSVTLEDLAYPGQRVAVDGFTTTGSVAPRATTLHSFAAPTDPPGPALLPTHTYRVVVTTHDPATGLWQVRTAVGSPTTDAVAPAAPTDLAVAYSVNGTHVSLTLPSDVDLDHVTVCSVAGPPVPASPADCATHTDVVVSHPISAAPTSLDVFPSGEPGFDPVQAHTWVAFAVDTSGNASLPASLVVPGATESTTVPAPAPGIEWETQQDGTSVVLRFRGDPFTAAFVPGSVQPAVPPVTAGVDSGRTLVIAGLNAGQTYSVSFFRWNSVFTHWSRSSVTFVVGTSSHDAVGATATPVVVYGSRPTVTATVSRVVSGSTSSTPLAGVPVELWSRTAPSATWVRIATGTTAATGKASFLRPTILATTAYQVRLAPQGYLYPAVVSSAAVTTALRPVLTASFAATSRVLAKSVKVRTKTYVYALVSPHRVTTVQLQRYVGGVWKAVSTVRTASTGRAAFSYRPTARGKQALRVVVVAGPSWTSAVSSGLRLVVS